MREREGGGGGEGGREGHRQADRQTDRQTDRQIDTQRNTDRHTHTDRDSYLMSLCVYMISLLRHSPLRGRHGFGTWSLHIGLS